MNRDLDITLIRAFVAVVDTGSVTGAARLLNRTQAAVSQQIKRLEEVLGTELFSREHKRLALAAAGERFLGNARRLVALNDETFGAMTTPAFEGEVRLGVPMDIVATYIPPILRRFNQAWPRVRVSLFCENSKELLEALEEGKVDLTLTTDRLSTEDSETLRRDWLVWVGAPDSEVYRDNPLPISIGGTSCRFRPVVLDALRQAGRDWRFVLEVWNQEAVNATVTAGLAVTATLRDSVPDGLHVLGPHAGLPELPEFAINLYLPRAGTTDIAEELARHIRLEFKVRFGTAEPGIDAAGRKKPIQAAPRFAVRERGMA